MNSQTLLIAGIAALISILALAAGAWLWLRWYKRPRGMVLMVPDIERPRVAEPAPGPEPAPEPESEPAPVEPEKPAHPLNIAIEPVKLAQTMMNMVLTFRLQLANEGSSTLEGLTVAADLVSAHASLPREAQMAGLDTELPRVHQAETLAPGETAEIKGELRLPLAQIVAIRQGKTEVLVPLARFRISAGGTDPRCFTLVVGQPSPGGGIQPVRLDQGPRSYHGLAGRAF